ncbi:MAG: isoprenylcysteine carboxylmethyltransferase family protein [Chloroflexales bacterium]|nr:isoprenylcysteine carboxylmethyltransferase family protein [Chloroflexales bacterium]
MNANTTQDSKVRIGAIRWLVRETLGNLILIAILFGIVGRWDWWMGWALSVIYILWTVSTAILILPVNPAMLAERARPHADVKKWDMALLGAIGLLMVAEYVIASLDVRWSWSPPLPLVLQGIGLVGAILGYDFLLVWAMVSNAFFVATVRIQTDRQHSVASSGPYRYVRHPGYLGTLLLHLGVPFMLNSLWAIIPAIMIALVLIVRTALEDKTLHAELSGYKEYAECVRYRLLPGVW